MVAVRKSGVITESSAAPYAPLRFAKPNKITNNQGSVLSYNIKSYTDTNYPEAYCRQDDGGVFTNYDAEADDATANDVFLLPAAEAVNDAFYFGSDLLFDRIDIWIGTAGVGGTITWEYWNGAWSALTVTDGTTGFTGVGYDDIYWTPPVDWVTTTVNATVGYWVRARVTAANFTAQPIADKIRMGGQNKANIIMDILADGTETRIAIGTRKDGDCGVFDLWINDVLDSSGYDDYAAVAADITRIITVTQPIRKGWNKIVLKMNGKNAASAAFSLNVYGIGVF